VSASGSVRVAGHTARTARDSLMQAEGIHDAAPATSSAEPTRTTRQVSAPP